MHSLQHEGHAQQVAVLKRNHIPHVRRGGLVGVDLGQEAEGEHDDAHPDPAEEHEQVAVYGKPLVAVLDIDVEPHERHHYVAGVVDYQDHRARRDLVAHS